MVRVPEYTMREVAPRAEFQTGIDVRASADAFGAQVGQGMQRVGQGLGQAADAFAQLQDFKYSLQSKDAFTAYEREAMEIDYGPNGYMTKQGRDAVDGLEARNKALEDLKRKHSASLPAGAQLRFNDAADASITGAMRNGIVHSAQGAKDWAAASHTSALENLKAQATAAYGNPAAVAKLVERGYAEIAAQADLMGLSGNQEILDLNRRAFATEVHRDVAIALASKPGGATKALEYVGANADAMDPKSRIELEAKLKPYANEEAAMKVVDEILTVPRQSAGAGTVGAGGPTNARARLYSRAAAAGKGKDHVDGLHEDFATNLNAMFDDAPPEIRDGLQIGSGYRSEERQAELFAEAVKKYGSAEAARKWVAPPGKSEHNSGTAVDIWYNGQRLDKAPAEVRQWVHDNAGAYGLRFPMSWESWHIEPANARGGGAGATVVPSRDGVSARASMASYDDAMARVNEIQDPEVRKAAMTQLNAQFEMRSKAETAAAGAAKSEIWSMVAQGVPLSQVPLDLKIAAGREAVTGFMDYEAKAGEITTDPMLHRDLTLFAATDPVAFAKTDLTAPEIINGLSKTDLKAFTEKQASVLGDERKAREEGLNITQAMGYASTQLKAVGIDSGSGNAVQKLAAAKQEASFQVALADEMRVWQEANAGKKPTQMDIQAMTNRLLLPIVIKTPGTLWDGKQEAFAFEAGSRADGTTVDVVVEYGDIPLDLRSGIALDLERELGRKPSQDEIVQRYEEFILSR